VRRRNAITHSVECSTTDDLPAWPYNNLGLDASAATPLGCQSCFSYLLTTECHFSLVPIILHSPPRLLSVQTLKEPSSHHRTHGPSSSPFRTVRLLAKRQTHGCLTPLARSLWSCIRLHHFAIHRPEVQAASFTANSLRLSLSVDNNLASSSQLVGQASL
jgi:hypothetical protein